MFSGSIDNVQLEVAIVPLRANTFAFELKANEITFTSDPISGLTKPVTVRLTIGDDQGTVTAK